jgi:hypothetical protein
MKPNSGMATSLEIESRVHRLSLTLGALAEIESALGCKDLRSLTDELKTLNAEKLSHVLVALLRAGGAEDAEGLAKRTNPVAAARAIGAVFNTGFSP